MRTFLADVSFSLWGRLERCLKERLKKKLEVQAVGFGDCNLEAFKVVDPDPEPPFIKKEQLEEVLSIFFDEECVNTHKRILTLFKTTITIETAFRKKDVLVLWGKDGKDLGTGFEKEGQEVTFDVDENVAVIAIGGNGGGGKDGTLLPGDAQGKVGGAGGGVGAVLVEQAKANKKNWILARSGNGGNGGNGVGDRGGNGGPGGIVKITVVKCNVVYARGGKGGRTGTPGKHALTGNIAQGGGGGGINVLEQDHDNLGLVFGGDGGDAQGEGTVGAKGIPVAADSSGTTSPYIKIEPGSDGKQVP